MNAGDAIKKACDHDSDAMLLARAAQVVHAEEMLRRSHRHGLSTSVSCICCRRLSYSGVSRGFLSVLKNYPFSELKFFCCSLALETGLDNE